MKKLILCVVFSTFLLSSYTFIVFAPEVLTVEVLQHSVVIKTNIKSLWILYDNVVHQGMQIFVVPIKYTVQCMMIGVN